MNIERADRKMREQEVGISIGPAKDELGVQVGVVRGLNCGSARMVLVFSKEPLGYPWVCRGLNCGLNGGISQNGCFNFPRNRWVSLGVSRVPGTRWVVL